MSESNQFCGWMIGEALRRTAESSLWDDWTKAKAAAEVSAASFRRNPTSPTTRTEYRGRLKKAARCRVALKTSFFSLVSEEKLVLLRLPAKAGGKWRRARLSLDTLGQIDWQSASLDFRNGARADTHDLRLFPILQSPDAPARFDGASLVEVFERHVLDDPEIKALGTKIRKEHGHKDLFKDKSCPGPFINPRWSLGYSADEYAFDFVRPIVIFFPNPNPVPKPSPLMRAIAAALADRISALQATLTQGDVFASGTFAQSGAFVRIDRRQWQRQNLSIDVESGDLCEGTSYRDPAIWTGISFQRGDQWSSPVENPRKQRRTGGQNLSRENGASSTRTSATRSSTEMALKVLYPKGVPAGVPNKVRNTNIINWQKQNGRAVASVKTIERICATQRKKQ